MQSYFDFEKHSTSLRQETLAGITTFFTLSYIIIVNPAILAAAGIPKEASMTATYIGTATLVTTPQDDQVLSIIMLIIMINTLLPFVKQVVHIEASHRRSSALGVDTIVQDRDLPMQTIDAHHER